MWAWVCGPLFPWPRSGSNVTVPAGIGLPPHVTVPETSYRPESEQPVSKPASRAAANTNAFGLVTGGLPGQAVGRRPVAAGPAETPEALHHRGATRGRHFFASAAFFFSGSGFFSAGFFPAGAFSPAAF